MDKETQKRRIAAGNFIDNNGSVLRTINALRYTYNKLSGIQYALPSLEKDEIMDSVNFLAEEGYIHLREIDSKSPATLADSEFDLLEAKLTGKGIRLLAGGENDDMIRI